MWRPDFDTETAVGLAGLLAAKAVEHANTVFQVWVHLSPPAVKVCVLDLDHTMPVARTTTSVTPAGSAGRRARGGRLPHPSGPPVGEPQGS